MVVILVATEKAFAGVAVTAIKEKAAQLGVELKWLENYKDVNDLYAAVADVDGLVVRSDKATKAVMDAGKNLKIIVRAGAGYDNVDLAAANEKKIVVMNTPGQNSNAVAELCFGMMVALARKQWIGESGSELFGRKIGLQAYGAVGVNVARIAKGFGMDVLAFDPFVEAKVMAEAGVKKVETVEELYQCDYVSLHMPLLPVTRECVTYELLSKMPKGATLLNTARAEVVKEEDIAKMLKERPDFKYGADVAPKIAKELKEKYGNRVLFTAKKMGAQTAEANVNAGVASVVQIHDFLKTGNNKFQVNKF